jgi:hypothetical protein
MCLQKTSNVLIRVTDYLRGRLYSVLAGHCRINKAVVSVAREVFEGWTLVRQ